MLASIMFLTTGCATERMPTPTVLVTQISPTLQATITDLPVLTLPTMTYVMPTATPTFVATQQPTSTSAATLPVNQAKTKVLELLKTNKGCKLPCWWGITAGHTSWDEAKSFLDVFSSESTTVFFSESSDFFSNFYFDINGENILGMNLELFVNNDIVRTLKVMDFDTPTYHLAEFLRVNGKPDQIWVLTHSLGQDNETGFVVFLFYKEQQMIAAYGKGRATIGATWITGCIKSSPAIFIWSLDKPFAFAEAAHLFGVNVDEATYIEISEATERALNAEKFYQRFRDPTLTPCFRTPKNLWPTP
jgi:hypothetical protein